MSKIARFTSDALVLRLLCLRKGLDDSNIKLRLLKLGQAGSHRLLETGLRFVNNWIGKYGLRLITIDCDSSECTVFGHQSGAEKGYNPKNKGKKSYHPLFDLLENSGHEYLVKTKLTKNIKSVFEESMWKENDAKNAVFEFDYLAVDWKKARKMYAVRLLKEYVKQDFFGKTEWVAVYDYFYYCTNLKRLSATQIHSLYGQRSESENWIEHTKNQLHVDQTTTNEFHVNNILWQLAVMTYNISMLMRYKSDHNLWRQKPKTFRDWFILVPGKIITTDLTTTVKMSKQYIYAKQWRCIAEKSRSPHRENRKNRKKLPFFQIYNDLAGYIMSNLQICVTFGEIITFFYEKNVHKKAKMYKKK